MLEDCELTMADQYNALSGRYKDLAASIVWTPIPILTWLLPCFGHIGIVTSTGVLRDFAGPYHVATDNMGFGEPTKFIPIDLEKVLGGAPALDSAISEASEEYKKRNHNLLCDNCHDFVAMALNQVQYDHSKWNMIKLALLMFVTGRFVSIGAFFKTWIPSLIIITLIVVFASVA